MTAEPAPPSPGGEDPPPSSSDAPVWAELERLHRIFLGAVAVLMVGGIGFGYIAGRTDGARPLDVTHYLMRASAAALLMAGVVAIVMLSRRFRTTHRELRDRLATQRKESEASRTEVALMERRFRQVTDGVNDVVFRADTDGRFVLLNRAWSRLTSTAVDHVIGRSILDFVRPEDRGRVQAMILDLLEGGRIQRSEQVGFVVGGFDGKVMISARNSIDRHGSYLDGTLVDITELVRNRRLVEVQSEILELVARGTDVNDVLAAIIDRLSPFAPGVAMRFRLGQDEEELSGAAVDGRLMVSESDAGDPMNHYAVLEWIRRQGVVLGEDFDTITSLTARLGALAIRRQYEADRVAHQASHDSLTGLPNRSELNRRLAEALDRIEEGDADPSGSPSASPETGLSVSPETNLAVMFIDLDRFKDVNDTLGHEAGDRLLVEIARRLRLVVRSTDTVARFGGDEFVILVERSQREHVIILVSRILAAVFDPVDVEVDVVVPSGSIGVAFRSEGASADDLLRFADLAMYQSKQNRPGNYAVFDQAMERTVATRRESEKAIRHALLADEFETWYQPIVDLSSRQLVGFEALVRWNRPDFGLVTPDEFIPLAEDLRLVADIDLWMLTSAGAQLERWIDVNPDLSVTVNVSGVGLVDPQNVAAMASEIGRIEAADHLVIEIKEGALAADPRLIGARLAELRRLGPRISIDDFGTTGGSARYLRELPVDIIKVDRMLLVDEIDIRGLNELPSRSPSAAAASVYVQLGRRLDLKVAVKRVETMEQSVFVTDNGFDHGQGFYFGAPVRVEEADAAVVGGIRIGDS